MRKRTGLLIAAGLLVAVGLIYLLTTYVAVPAPQPSQPAAASSMPGDTDVRGVRDDSSANLSGSASSGKDENTASKGDRAIAAIEPPDLDVIRDEVEADPHSTPPSMLQFARNMGKRMEQALESRATAASLFKELSDCASSETGVTAPSVKALCLSNAARLAEKYPDDFLSSYRELKENSGDDVTDLIRALEKVE